MRSEERGVRRIIMNFFSAESEIWDMHFKADR
jgi:hypothetical protein